MGFFGAVKHRVKLFVHFFEYRSKNKKIVKETRLRKEGNRDSKFEKIASLRDVYSGKRCFIVATGPSLTLDDLNLIKNEICFSMNSMCKMFDKTSWRPTFYGVQDAHIYEHMKDDMEHYIDSNTIVLIADHLEEYFKIPQKYCLFPFNHYYHQYEAEKRQYFVKFSNESDVIVYDGYTITYSLIQIAIYMGFSEICLLGVDFNYQQGQKNHFVDSGYVDKNIYSEYKRMLLSYEKAKEFADNHGIHIFNCTRGGMLEVFPRKSLEDCLK